MKDFIKIGTTIFKRDTIERIELKEVTIVVYQLSGKDSSFVFENIEEAKKAFEDIMTEKV